MNFKKSATLLFLITLLTGCNFNNEPAPVDPGTPIDPVDPVDSVEEGYKKLPTSVETYYSYGKKYSENKHYSNSVGNQKLLVVPVIIDGYESNATSENKSKLEKAFFGDNESTGFESVASYYKKSSFNKLDLTGEVVDWVDIDMSPLDIYNARDVKGDYGTFTVLEKVYEILKRQNFDFTTYDVDKDGYIDSIYMIFSCETRIAFDYVTSEDPNNPFWAITYADLKIMDNEHSVTNPIPHMYSWSSYDLLNNGKSVNIDIDAHTYIHEFGHILGLDDYYDYDNLHCPLGCFDMQDFNVGDHNAFSKYAFGWTTPYYVTGDAEITIHPSNLTGESIIIKNPNSEFANSAFDEYLMLELLTSDNLWKQDASYPYINVNRKTFQNPGVRLLHVDARCITNTGDIVSIFPEGSKIKQLCSNTPSRSYVNITNPNISKYDLVNIIPANNLKGYQKNNVYPASDAALFKKGQVFVSGDYDFFFDNGKLHNKEEIPYRITFKEVSNEKAVISFKVVD